MALVRMVLVFMVVLLFCLAQVFSESNTDQDHETQVGYTPQVSSESNTDQDHETQVVVKGPNRRLLPYLNCQEKCNARCRLHSRQNVCTRACGTCCVRCKCVPPGTAGNREACGRCYTDMTTHGNRLKCP